MTTTEPLQHCGHNVMANIHPREVSIITQGESDHDDNIDVEDDGEDATEVDISNWPRWSGRS